MQIVSLGEANETGKNFISLLFAEFAQRVVKVKYWSISSKTNKRHFWEKKIISITINTI